MVTFPAHTATYACTTGPRGTTLSRMHNPAQRKVPSCLKSRTFKKNSDEQLRGKHHCHYLYHICTIVQQLQAHGCADLLAARHQHASSILPVRHLRLHPRRYYASCL